MPGLTTIARNHHKKRHIAIVGGGPAGLMAAEVMSNDPNCTITVYDALPSVGRKLLMAGRGGLNLTHSEPMDAFVARYRERADQIRPVIATWSPNDVQAWCEALGQQTFVGTSGRIFPKIMKASGLLRAWLQRLDGTGVALQTRHRWRGWDDDGQLRFCTLDGKRSVTADATILALGGASWPRLGSDGAWVPLLTGEGISVAPLRPANVGFQIAWSKVFLERFEGKPLKNIALSTIDSLSVRGEAVITTTGIEGGAVYAISASLRDALHMNRQTTLTIDLKPDIDHPTLTSLFARSRGKQSMVTYLRKAVRLPPVAIGLLQEVALETGRPLANLSPENLAIAVKAVPLTLCGTSPIDRAISSAGGVRFEEVDSRFMLHKRPGVFIAGEMLDWEAPTGGYLLQACFATGVAAGKGAIDWLKETRS
ncbi:MAG: TIGR03862 family flavoprotein [Hyphomicrobiaceae bacterium]